MEWVKEFQKFNYICSVSKFSKLANKLDKKQGVSKAGANALAAYIGREKYGKKKFQQMAVAGKKKK